MRKRVLAIGLIAAAALSLTACDSSDYKKATSLYEDGQYAEAAEQFEALGDYEDSAEMVLTCKYAEAKELFEAADYEAAKVLFTELADYEDSAQMIQECEKELMYQTYGDVIAALTTGTWYFNGGSDTVLNSISFTDSEAAIAQVYYDGNGKHDNGSNSYEYVIDDANISLTMADGSTMDIAYSVDGDKVSLGNGEYLSAEEVDAGLQGFWTLSYNSFGKKEYNIHLDNGSVTAESAAGAAGGYYYYGPYEGTYTINFGGLDTEIMHGGEWFWNIIDGAPTMLHYDRVCSPSDHLPGEDGYSM